MTTPLPKVENLPYFQKFKQCLFTYQIISSADPKFYEKVDKNICSRQQFMNIITTVILYFYNVDKTKLEMSGNFNVGKRICGIYNGVEYVFDDTYLEVFGEPLFTARLLSVKELWQAYLKQELN